MQNNSLPFDPLSLAYNPKKKKRITLPSKRKLFGICSAVIILIAISIGSFLFLHHQKANNTPDELERKAEQEAAVKKKDLLNTVSEQISLPTNEDPILATVSDRNSLQNQDFFKDAQNGDRILMYPKNKKAFLYRPSTRKVLAVAPLQYEVGKPETASVAGELTTPTEGAAPEQSFVLKPTVVPHGKILIKPQ